MISTPPFPKLIELLTLLLTLATLAPAWGQKTSPPQIETARLGLPSGTGGESGRSRTGAWTPVYVKLKASKDGNAVDQYKIAISAKDIEGVPYRYTVALPALAANQDYLAIGYVRPGAGDSPLQVQVQRLDGEVLSRAVSVARDSDRETLAPRDFLFLAVGARLSGLNRALQPEPPKQGEDGAPEQPEPEDKGLRRFAYVESVAQMPDRWQGYDAVDVVVLSTGRDAFVKDLLEDQSSRRDALLEWVRRGGKLVLSVARNHQDVARILEEKTPFIHCGIKGTLRRKTLGNLHFWSGSPWAMRDVDIADLEPGPDTQVMVREVPDQVDRKDRPLLVQSACGLGRVVLVGFDLDLQPFVGWTGQRAFWTKLLSELLPSFAADNARKLNPNNFMPVLPEQEPELLTDLQRGLETFESVPVISFAWVALFILIYILVVGPLDYFVLKKVFKRLELTWITFPLIVIAISVVAYLIAYNAKGDDLRVNKIDLVDIDLHGSQAYGTTWFTLFSPHIKNYTVGIEPAAPGWVAGPGLVTVAPLALPEASNRVGAPPGLFPQPYLFAEDGSGLEKVPIPVWSTRSFTASWRAPLSAERPPIEADLALSRDEARLPCGNITNHLPVELQDFVIIYHGKWYSLPVEWKKWVPEETRRIETLFGKDPRGDNLDSFFRNGDVLMPKEQRSADEGVPARFIGTGQTSHQLMKALMFRGKAGTHDHRNNSGLRSLDESWRLGEAPNLPTNRYREEIILVARTAPVTGQADRVIQDGSSPTRLWLDKLPGSVPQRPSQRGVINQETYLRVYIPVKTTGRP